MTTQPSPSDPVFSSYWRNSHRTRPEQLVGMGIYLCIGLGCTYISGLMTQFLSFFYALFFSFGMWALWRSYSLRVLKLELSAFLAQLVLQMAWGLSSFFLQEELLVLVFLLLLFCNTLLMTLLFWKKERLAGVLYLFPLLWVFYLSWANMIFCIANP